ncbi:MAG: PDZ domain-containing protein [Crocinitomicaceae bacterium]|nr:PDZ domain-containing protein [Crocinitomicaceae bacterium]
MFKSTLIIFLQVLIVSSVFGQGTRVLRNPDISEQHIVFAYGGDLWTSDHTGGNVRRITTYQGVESEPKISPDGKTVAFTGQYDGNVDVFTVSIEGGQPKRLTWHPGADIVSGWTNDGQSILFSSGRTNAPYQDAEEFWQVNINGGTPSKFIVPTGLNGEFSPNGEYYVYEPISPWETEFRNYRGGQNYPLWIFNLSTHAVEKMPWENSRDIRPVWIRDNIYFLSDRDLAMNVWVYNTSSKTLKQITHFKEFDCKNLEGTGNNLVFENGGYLHTINLEEKSIIQLSITVTGDFQWMRPHYVGIDRFLDSYNISPNGKRIVLSARGEVITVPVKDGTPRNITNSTGAADRECAWSADGTKISWFTDESGEYQLVVADQFGNDRKIYKLDNPTFYYEARWSPDSKSISFYNEGRELQFIDLASGKITQIDNEGSAHPVHVIYGDWSPDSKWITYTKRLKNEFSAVFIYSIEAKKSYQITDGMANCSSPTWDESGDYLYFLASIDYGPNSAWLDMSQLDHVTNSTIYALALNKGVKSPLKIDRGNEEVEAADDNDEEEEEEMSVVIDFEGMETRMTPLPIEARNFESVIAASEGVIFYSEHVANEEGLTLYKFELGSEEPSKVTSGIWEFNVDQSKQHLIYIKSGNSFFVGSVDAPDKAEPVNVSQVKIKVDPIAEAKQIFKEAWRYQRDYFYVENVHGLDMEWAYDAYSPWVDHVRHRSDLNYILDILGGETAIGHSFVGGGDYPKIDRMSIGLLGADFKITNKGVQIAKIYTGEMWNQGVDSPMSGVGIDISTGDYIVAVNGVPVDSEENFFMAFENLANKEITLSVNSTPDLKGAREVIVSTVGNESMLRRFDWVEGNRRKVDELSEGKLAYVWLPNTGDGGFNYFNRYYFAQKDKKGIIVDERDNHGGLIADYITDLLSRELLGYFNNPIGDQQPMTAPDGALFGPKVMLINENAGSGGDMLPFMFKKRKLGTLVGTTTWGGLVGIWDVPGLMDGGRITAPRGGFYNTEGQWDVENIGVSPDIRVEQDPALVIEGHDPQLEEGVRVALEMLKTQEVILIPQPADPVRSVRPK